MSDKKPILIGFGGSIVLLILYFGILTIAESFSHAVQQFKSVWSLILLLVTGFGIQVGLYSYIRAEIRAKQIAGATKTVAATGGVSTGSMIACCAHHLTDILPIIGLSAAAVFLEKYQLLFIVIGVLSNLVGITMMLGIIQKHELFDLEKGFFKKILRYDMGTIRNSTIALSVIIATGMFITIAGSTGPEIENFDIPATIETVVDMPTKINDENGVNIEVTPVDFSLDNPVKFDVTITTHEGALDFDMKEISSLEDGEGNEYLPLSWEGSPPGGHHRSGTLTFPALEGETKQIKLTIENVYDVQKRVFIWSL